jgi:mRNA interferase YafQ
MTSKKSASSKRASLPRIPDFTKDFRKDWQRLTYSGRYDMNRLKEAMLLLIAGNTSLGVEWLDHPLKGDWSDYRECHIGGDFLLIYQIRGDRLSFVRAGTHADLFGEWISNRETSCD